MALLRALGWRNPGLLQGAKRKEDEKQHKTTKSCRSKEFRRKGFWKNIEEEEEDEEEEEEEEEEAEEEE